MKTIKFRAWNKEENRILQGEPNFVNQHFYENENSKFPNLGTDFRVLEIMQFTGLLDKNGKEIYEGDIVAQAAHYPPEHQKEVLRHKYGHIFSRPVEFKDGIYWVGGDNKDLEIISNHLEIIGNIYENPELISQT